MKGELVTTFERKATEIVSRIFEEDEPVLITQYGFPAAYLVD